MRAIQLRCDLTLKSVDVIREVLAKAPSGINIDTMRRRMRVLDTLEKSTDTLQIEDADWLVLKDAIAVYPFAIAHQDLVVIADDIENAKS